MNNDRSNLPPETFVSIPQEILNTAAAGAREQLQRLVSESVPAVYKTLLADVSGRFLDPDLDRIELWEKHGLNEKNHSKQLTQALGDSLWSFIRKLRAETAGHLLADPRIGHVHLYVVALATGFKSSCALNAAFKAWSGGITPSDFRKSRLAEPYPRTAPFPAEETQQRQPSATVRRALQAVYRLAMHAGPLERATFDSALAKLREVDCLIERYRLEDTNGEAAAHRGLLYHCRGADRMMDLDLDGAYADLAAATHFYALSPRLPRLLRRARERILYPADTQAQLLKQLCASCRSGLLAAGGRTVREYLHRALVQVPRDLGWFQICCDNCYRVIWGAIEKARLGLLDDAWKASWLVAHADPFEDVSPSLARYLRALHEAELLTHEEQRPRLKFCREAAETARSLHDSLRTAYALCFVANTLRVMAAFDEARATLLAASKHCHENPWSAAFLVESEGRLAVKEKNHNLARDKLNSARVFYSQLDLHLVGYILIAQGELSFNEGGYETAVRAFDEASSALDRRRAPVLVSGAIPLNSAAALAALGRQSEAKAALSRCDFDRSDHRRMAATELLVSGCLALAEDRREDALGFFRQAATTFESLDRLREKALALAYSVEAYAGIGNRAKAIASAAEALQLFQDLRCNQDTVEAFAQLREQLESTVIDDAIVAGSVRRLAKAHGGWLP